MQYKVLEILERELDEAYDNLIRAEMSGIQELINDYKKWYNETQKAIEWVKSK